MHMQFQYIKCWLDRGLSNSYTMGCPPVLGDNPRALASGLSYVQVDKHGITIFFTTYISVDLAHHAKGGIINEIRLIKSPDFFVIYNSGI